MDNKGVVEQLYNSLNNLPNSYPKEFSMVNSGLKDRNGNMSSALMTGDDKKYHGIFGRIKMWKDRILNVYYKTPVFEMAKQGNLEVRVSNNFFRSRFTVYDKINKVRLKAKSTIFSSLFSYLFGSFVKLKLEEY